MNALISSFSDFLKLASSAISTISLPCIVISVSLFPMSPMLSRKKSSPPNVASARRAIDLPSPWPPSRIRTLSNLQPGEKTRLTAPISHFEPTRARYSGGCSSAPR